MMRTLGAILLASACGCGAGSADNTGSAGAATNVDASTVASRADMDASPAGGDASLASGDVTSGSSSSTAVRLQDAGSADAPTSTDSGPDATKAIDAGTDGGETVGGGSLSTPAIGPGPSMASRVGSPSFTLVKNWDFGTSGTIRNNVDLSEEFDFHDQFGTIANGTHYGAVIVAPDSKSAIGSLPAALNLPNDEQPVEDPARPTRVYTADTIQCKVQPLSSTQTTCTASAHDVGAGSFVAKWRVPNGGKLLGHDVLWETRVRLVNPCPAYWFALWTSGNQWNKGAEVDTPETFGAANVFPPAHLFHVNSVGGNDAISYSDWSKGMAEAGIPGGTTDLTAWHTWTWLYRADDTYTTWLDDYQVQSGSIHWTYGATEAGAPIDMTFLFDLTWANTSVSSVNPSNVTASQVNMTYEIDYSRVYLR